MAEFTNIKINDVQYDVKDANAARASALATKQDVISDLSIIRSGAQAGATAIQQADLAAVATSGSYNDLADKPTIPAAITVDSTITQNGTNPVQGGAIYSALEGKEDRQVEIINLYYNGNEPTWTNSSGDPMTVVQVNTLLRNSSKNVIIKATFDDIGRVDGTRLYYRTSPIDDDYILFYALEYKRVYWLGIDADLSDYSQMYLEDIGTVDISSYVQTSFKINNKPLSGENMTLTASDVGALPSTTHIPADQVQSNWNETNTSSKAYIQNKPTFKTINGESIVGTGDIETGSGNVVTPVVNVASTGNVTQELQAGAFYKFGTVDSLTITLAPGNTPLDGTTPLLVYGGKFTISASSSASSLLALPASVTISPRSDSVAVGKTYEFNIADNGAIILEM